MRRWRRLDLPCRVPKQPRRFRRRRPSALTRILYQVGLKHDHQVLAARPFSAHTRPQQLPLASSLNPAAVVSARRSAGSGSLGTVSIRRAGERAHLRGSTARSRNLPRYAFVVFRYRPRILLVTCRHDRRVDLACTLTRHALRLSAVRHAAQLTHRWRNASFQSRMVSSGPRAADHRNRESWGDLCRFDAHWYAVFLFQR